MVSVAFTLALPGRVLEGVGYPLHEQCRADVTLAVAECRVESRMYIPFDAREFRQPTISRRVERGTQLRPDPVFVRQKVNGRTELDTILRQTREAGQPRERQVEFEGRSRSLARVEPAIEVG